MQDRAGLTLTHWHARGHAQMLGVFAARGLAAWRNSSRWADIVDDISRYLTFQSSALRDEWLMRVGYVI